MASYKYHVVKSRAKGGLLVRWDLSGIYESLSLDHTGSIVAHGPITRIHTLEKRRIFRFIIVPKDQWITIGELISSRIPFDQLKFYKAPFSDENEERNAIKNMLTSELGGRTYLRPIGD